MSNSIREISFELQQVAIKELHEDPKRIQDDIEHIREWQSKQVHLKGRTDAQWLLAFIRGCKHNMQKIKQKLDMYYAHKTLVPSLMQQRNPFDEGMQRLLKLGIILPLPLTHNGRRIILIRFNNDASDMPAAFKLILMQREIQLLEDDHYAINGCIAIGDIKYMTTSHMFDHLRLWQQFLKCIWKGYPSGVKEIYLLNINQYAEAIVTVFKTFLPEKQKARASFYGVGKEAQLYNRIPQKYLPKEYGGENGSLPEITEYWKKKLESYCNYFQEDEMYCSDESKRLDLPQFKQDLFGVEGSFKKLNLD